MADFENKNRKFAYWVAGVITTLASLIVVIYYATSPNRILEPQIEQISYWAKVGDTHKIILTLSQISKNGTVKEVHLLGESNQVSLASRGGHTVETKGISEAFSLGWNLVWPSTHQAGTEGIELRLIMKTPLVPWMLFSAILWTLLFWSALRWYQFATKPVLDAEEEIKQKRQEILERVEELEKLELAQANVFQMRSGGLNTQEEEEVVEILDDLAFFTTNLRRKLKLTNRPQ